MEVLSHPGDNQEKGFVGITLLYYTLSTAERYNQYFKPLYAIPLDLPISTLLFYYAVDELLKVFLLIDANEMLAVVTK